MDSVLSIPRIASPAVAGYDDGLDMKNATVAAR
jgi:hypothetical protein